MAHGFEIIDKAAQKVYADLGAGLKELASLIVNDKIPPERKSELVAEWTKVLAAIMKQQRISVHKLKPPGGQRSSASVKRALELIKFQLDQSKKMLRYIQRLNAALRKEISAP